GQDHSETLTAEGRSHKGLGPEQLFGQPVLREETEDVDSLVRNALARQQQTNGERIWARDSEGSAGTPSHFRTRAQQDVETLSRLLATSEDHLVRSSMRVGGGRSQHPVWHHFVVTR